MPRMAIQSATATRWSHATPYARRTSSVSGHSRNRRYAGRGRARPPRRRPLQSHVERAAVLLVLHAELVHAGIQPHRPHLRIHVGRRCPPNHQFAIQPHVEAVVALAVQFDFARFGRVPVAGPAHAEESPGQVGIVVQEVEGDRGADVVEERSAIEADIGKDLPADAGPVRRGGAEDKQERGEPGGHADGPEGQGAKPLPVEP